MKTTELMIGDWMQFANGNKKCMVVGIKCDARYLTDEVTITVMDSSGHCFDKTIDELKPIPLTPEILEKNGFTKRKDVQWVIEKKRIVGCCGQTCSNTNPMVYVIWVDKGYMGVVNYQTEANITKAGSYVHELQQCIRLCGIDKEITL